MAVSCAAAWQAQKLIFLTDVTGVRGAEGKQLSRLTLSQSRQLIETGVAHGGMQAKLEAAETALRQGVAEVVIASGREPQICARLLAGEELGTTLEVGA
jgi:acetylglutamate kinase